MAARRHFWRNLDVVYQKIPKPPCSAAVRQAAANEPDFVATPHVRRGIDGIEFGVGQGRSFARCWFLITVI
jgi:hypothetical protein